MDHYKSMLPSQLMAERGAEIVVINPGSANVRIGLASGQSPISVPHCVAHLTTAKTSSETLSDNMVRTPPLSAARQSEREAVCEMVERQLKIPSSGQSASKPYELTSNHGGAYSGRSVDKTSFSYLWTDVRIPGQDRNSQQSDTEPGQRSAEDKSRSGDGVPAETRCETGPAKLNDKGEHSVVRRAHIYGDEAFKIPADEPYILRRPMCRGRLNISQQYSLQQVSDDLFAIWNWVLTEKLGLSAQERQKLVVVLVIPDTLDNREVKEMISVVLKDLQFNCAVVHQECVAATFGNGLSSACVVNLGAQVTSVMCVEDGVAFPSSQVVLPFGGEDISRCLLWVQQRWKTWPPVRTDPHHDPLALLMLSNMKESYCRVAEGDCSAVIRMQDPLAGTATRTFEVTLTALNVPSMGMFAPSLLAPEEHMPLLRPWYHLDHEDPLDDPFHQETSKKAEVADAGATGGNSIHFLTGAGSENASVNGTGTVKPGMGDYTMSLQQAIVSSILSLGRPDLQKRLFSSLQLVGGVALTKGLVDAVEDRVLQEIPATEAVDTVEVLINRTSPSFVTWKGGAILGVLDLARETWIQRDDWLEGGVRVGSGRKYKDSNTQQAQTFWYCSMFDQ